MSSISLDDVKKLATLSSVILSDDQIQAMQTDLTNIFGYVEQLQTVDTEGVDPTYDVHGLETVVRPDEIIDYEISREALLQNAPKQLNGSIVVPRVLE